MAAVAVLLAVTAAGLRARGPFSHTGNQTAAAVSGPVLAIALGAAEGIAVIAFLVVLASARPERKPPDDEEEPWRPAVPWWAKAAGVLLAVAALLAPLAVLLTRKPRRLSTRPLAGAPGIGPRTLTAPLAGSAWPLITGMVIAILVVLALTVLSRRRRAGRTARTSTRRLATLLDSLAAASDALTRPGEPRAAIIACYTAMERGFAAAGSAPAAADTPAEVLARATGAGLVRPEPAQALTGLFRRARYSAYPMTSADATAAADALTELRADLASQGAAP